MKKTLCLMLTVSFLFSSCVSQIYTISQFREKDHISKKLLKKRVQIVKIDDQVIRGYLKTIEPDSLIIINTNRMQIISEFKIASSDIKTICMKKKKNPAVTVGIIGGVLYFVTFLGLLSSSGSWTK